ncbi:hypothetical protein HYV86_01555 [Candidatus Woesearchaeota archaeon]|nr:hypothetical protein [Candidatus Woesearchaeota archaeon]
MIKADSKKNKTLTTKFFVSLFAIILSTALVSSQVQAGLLDPIIDPIQAEWDRFTDRVENELESTPIGREVSRIVEDVESVARIVEEFEGLITMATSSIPAVALVNLAVQYGHDPESVLPRFNERVEEVKARHHSVQLTEVEAAAILQSVLEEPPMPDGVYLGDNCIIDFSQCPDESTNPSPRSRAFYWDYSCYTQGVVDKLVVPTPQNANQRRAVCTASWINMWNNGQLATSKFPASIQYATYDWQRCARVYLTQTEQDQFLAQRDSICQQPIAKHDLGEICVVDYRSCSYGVYGAYNANRVGTITYGDVINQNFQFRREYACDTTYGTFALKPQLRDSCARVYVGDREVAEFIDANPEPVQQVPQNPPQKETPPPPPAQQGSPTTLQGVFTRTIRTVPLHELNLAAVQSLPSREVYGRTGIMNLAPDVVKQKEAVKVKVEQLIAPKKLNLDIIVNEIRGQQLPSPIDSIFGNEKIHVTITQNDGNNVLLCITIQDGIVTEAGSCNDNDSFTPTLKVQTSQAVLESLTGPADLTAAMNDGRITYQAVGLGKKIKFGISSLLAKIFG